MMKNLTKKMMNLKKNPLLEGKKNESILYKMILENKFCSNVTHSILLVHEWFEIENIADNNVTDRAHIHLINILILLICLQWASFIERSPISFTIHNKPTKA